ncbi:MAG TPA: bifunctional phosphopantothenoylcysteine decarboxylase/phosphopantothenate--cysteine ligase CoaBC, partial [Gemmatimonadaceae bacterium]
AMNDQMWGHAQTQQNVKHLRTLGYTILEPTTGELAAGEGSGPGRMPEPEIIFAHVGKLLESQSLAGATVLVTAGPTREAIDPVRYISNRSSGKMGAALAEAAWRRGATVSVVAGPLEVDLPAGIEAEHVESTTEMSAAISRRLPKADVLIMAAAPADFQATSVESKKIKRGAGTKSIAVKPTDDILAATKGKRKKGSIIVGFALETGSATNGARTKLGEKGLDLVVANDATEPGAGFAVDTNRVTLINKSGQEEALPLMSKAAVADAILDRVERLRSGR